MEPVALRNSPPLGRTRQFFGYLGTVVASGIVLALAVVAVGFPWALPAPMTFWSFVALAVAADLGAPVWRERDSPPVYPSICFTFAILLVWGLAPALLVQGASVIVASALARHARWRVAFNAGRYVLAYGATGVVLALFPTPVSVTTGRGVLLVLAGAITWLSVNHVLLTWAVWLRFGGSWGRVFGRTMATEGTGTLALLLFAPVMVAAAFVNGWLLALALVPLFALQRINGLTRDRERLVDRDPLTGLASRAALAARVARHVRPPGGSAAAPPLALLLLDLDRFKQINDALGHRVGDQLLREVSRRLTRLAGPADVVGRLGGDEFAVVLPSVPDTATAHRQATRMARALAEPVAVEGHLLEVAGSIGVALYPEHGGDFATLMQHADVAMYEAKDTGDGVAVYAPESDQNSPDRLALLADLRRTLAATDEGFALHYQPQVEISTEEVVGLEALLRWRHPRRGPIDPQELIRVAEHSPVMRLLTYRVLEDVITQLAVWGEAAVGLRVAVNVSARDLHNEDLVDRIAALLDTYGVRAGQLQLEITESALLADPQNVVGTLLRLRRLGVSVALDDFGTGYSSMRHLRELPLTEVKIDRTFVNGITTDGGNAAIVRSIIDLAGALGMRVVAEGVEDERTWRMLAAAGCHLAQGWYCAKPMPADETLAWLELRRGRRPALAGQVRLVDLPASLLS